MRKRNGPGKEREGCVGDRMEKKEWRGGLLRGVEHRVVRGNEDRRMRMERGI